MEKVKHKKIIKEKEQNDDKFIDSFLRPGSWLEYIGQEKVKKNLNLIMAAARKRNESIDHLLLCGPTGLGKTTLATLVAKEMRGNLKIITGPTLQRVGELAAILSSLENRDILFIHQVWGRRQHCEDAYTGE